MMHPFIKEYFKDIIDSIKEFHNKVNYKNNNTINTVNDSYTIYSEDDDYYVTKNDDISSAKHITMFTIPDILNMHLGPNVNQIELEKFILSII